MEETGDPQLVHDISRHPTADDSGAWRVIRPLAEAVQLHAAPCADPRWQRWESADGGGIFQMSCGGCGSYE